MFISHSSTGRTQETLQQSSSVRTTPWNSTSGSIAAVYSKIKRNSRCVNKMERWKERRVALTQDHKFEFFSTDVQRFLWLLIFIIYLSPLWICKVKPAIFFRRLEISLQYIRLRIFRTRDCCTQITYIYLEFRIKQLNSLKKVLFMLIKCQSTEL